MRKVIGNHRYKNARMSESNCGKTREDWSKWKGKMRYEYNNREVETKFSKQYSIRSPE